MVIYNGGGKVHEIVIQKYIIRCIRVRQGVFEKKLSNLVKQDGGEYVVQGL